MVGLTVTYAMDMTNALIRRLMVEAPAAVFSWPRGRDTLQAPEPPAPPPRRETAPGAQGSYLVGTG